MNDLSLLGSSLWAGGDPGVLLAKCNAKTEPYGLRLTAAGLERLMKSRAEALRSTGRVEVGEGALTSLVDAFRTSPYLLPSHYEETLMDLQELFYSFKNDCKDLLTDQELAEAMALVFNEAAQGSMEFLSELDWQDIYRVAVTGSLEGTGLGADGGDDE